MGRQDLAKFSAIVAPTTLAIDQRIEVLDKFRDILPNSSLRRGSVGVLGGELGSGITSLLFGLLARPSSMGNWIAIVGSPNLGFAAARDHGVDLKRLLNVKCTSSEAVEIAAIMLDGFDIVVLSSPLDATRARKLSERTRKTKSILIYLSTLGKKGATWPGSCDFSLLAKGSSWQLDGSAPIATRTLKIEVSANKWSASKMQLVVGL
ncbi:hypothetical protein [Acidithrix ferrooxidans]|uniref:Uncharacterized protein n=1 Tax=Acidithrix ferrooxidans TaxID=1280514 RepID=A0A0D8HL33_9ACTN|nr:hypothetical protein [Acidithrix ferrooxidans]KJF17801.1 hypothetical protein AXFE_12980 [Acidithrix ferrooxidans]